MNSVSAMSFTRRDNQVVDERILISFLEAWREVPKGRKTVSDRISQRAAVSALGEG